MSAQKLISKFRSFGLPIDGVALLRNGILTVGDRTIDVHSCNFGYLRTSGVKRYRVGQKITGCDTLNEVEEDMFLVLILAEDKNLDQYLKAAKQILDGQQDIQITQVDINKELIQKAEGIPPSLNKIARISFEYQYQEVGVCPEGLCEYVADVQCDVEPCESKSFCERVQECLPEPVDTDCTLQVGSGCCDYRVEGIDLRSRCFTICYAEEYIWDLNIASPPPISFPLSFGITVGAPEIDEQLIIDELGTYNLETGILTLTGEAIAEYFFENIVMLENYFIEINGRCLTIYATGGISGFEGFVVMENTTINLDVTEQFTINSCATNNPYSTITQQQPTEELPNTYLLYADSGGVIADFIFQVNINGQWQTIDPEQIQNGVWERQNVCDDVITEWRIIDSEENVIDSGEVTATCDDAEQVTDSVCNWLQAHQTAIEELENNPSGLTCETLAECDVITDIQDTLSDKANTADLGATAFSNDYNDLDNLPSIPAAQIQSDWYQANNLLPDFIKNKPTIPTVPTNVSAFTNDAGYVNQAGARSALSFVAGSGGYNSGTGVITIPTNNNQLTNGAGYQTASDVTNAINAAKPITLIGIDTTANALTGNVTNGILGTVLIPANSLSLNSIIEVEAFLTKANPSATIGHRIWISPNAGNLTGATQLSVFTGATNSGVSKMERSFLRTSGGLTIFPPNISSGVDDTNNATPVSNVTVDWTINQYLHHTANNASGETTTNIFLYAKKATP